AMCPRVGRMGLISDDGLGQNNLIRSESPWGGVEPHSKVVHQGVVGPTPSGITESGYTVHEGQWQTKCPLTYAGSRLKRWMQWEGPVRNQTFPAVGGNTRRTE